MSQTTATEPSASLKRLELFRMVNAFWVSQALYTAATLRLADLVHDGSRTIDDLARQTGADPSSLYRLLRALTSVGVFVEESPGRFGVTQLGAYLQSNRPDSLHAAALVYGSPYLWTAWGNLLHSVKTGKPAFDHVHHQGFFEYLGAHREESECFNQHAAKAAAWRQGPLLAGYDDFASIKVLIDVGGGYGAMLAAVLCAHPAMRGILFDAPHVVTGAAPVLEAAGVAGRCTVVAGDFFVEVPSGADACLLAAILHDWDDERALRILRNCHRALPAGGRLLVLDHIVPEQKVSGETAFMDLNMLVVLPGKERTAVEFRDLFEAAGFQLKRVLQLSPLAGLVEGYRS
jgi:SAM-dependent methyltransferase